jgi:hypothetical protein
VSNFPLAMHVSFEAKVPVIINDICSWEKWALIYCFLTILSKSASDHFVFFI